MKGPQNSGPTGFKLGTVTKKMQEHPKIQGHFLSFNPFRTCPAALHNFKRLHYPPPSFLPLWNPMLKKCKSAKSAKHTQPTHPPTHKYTHRHRHKHRHTHTDTHTHTPTHPPTHARTHARPRTHAPTHTHTAGNCDLCRNVRELNLSTPGIS